MFQNEVEYVAHRRERHRVKDMPITCWECGESFKLYVDHSQHRIKVHGYGRKKVSTYSVCVVSTYSVSGAVGQSPVRSAAELCYFQQESSRSSTESCASPRME